MNTALMLIERGANVTDTDNHGFTPLHLACSEGQIDTAVMLLERGVDITDTDNAGCTPFHWTCLKGHMDISLMLIYRAIDDSQPIDLALRFGHSDLALMLKEKFVCARQDCFNPPTSQCSRCLRMFYCSKECQVAEWCKHKKRCRKKA